MLGRALDAAENDERQQLPFRSGRDSDHSRNTYGSTDVDGQHKDGATGNTKQDQQPPEEDGEESIANNASRTVGFQEHQDQLSSTATEPSLLQRLKKIWDFVANVDDLWDSPQIGEVGSDSRPQDSSSSIGRRRGGPNNRQQAEHRHIQSDHHRQNSRRSYVIVLFWFSVLSTTYATERVSFKLIVDRAGPFRLFSAETIAATHVMVLGILMLANSFNADNFEFKSLGLPVVDVGLMAVLDTIHLVLAVTAGSYVSPTMTVILVQLTIPLTAFFTQFVHPSGACSSSNSNQSRDTEIDEEGNMAGGEEAQRLCPNDGGEEDAGENYGGLKPSHIWGSAILFTAVVLGLIPPLMSFKNPTKFESQDTVPIRYAYNTVVFALSCIPAAASQLYKEHTLFRHKQPVDANYLNLILSIFQFIIAMVLSPLVYTLQGLGGGDGWETMYPSREVSKNFIDGLRCFLGVLDSETAKNEYPEDAQCNLLGLIVLVHVITIIVIGYAVDKIVHAGSTKIVYRGTSVGIILAIFAMYLYEYLDPFLNYGTVINILHFSCTGLVILGAEIYHRENIQDATFETIYPEIENLYDDEFS